MDDHPRALTPLSGLLRLRLPQRVMVEYPIVMAGTIVSDGAFRPVQLLLCEQARFD
jgi:hypothetical protein